MKRPLRCAQIAWIALLSATAGCAPLGYFRPVGGFVDDRTQELGMASVGVSPRPWVVEPWAYTGQLWYTVKARSRVNLSVIGAFDRQAAAGGVAGQVAFAQGNRGAVGLDAEVGYAWAAASLPVAVRLFDRTWIYGAPRGGTYGPTPVFGVPMGLSAYLGNGLSLRAEYQVSWAELKVYNRRQHLGAGLAVQW